MPDASTAIIQFVGLLVFSTQLSNDPGLLQAVMPRVAPERAHAERMVMTKSGRVPRDTAEAPHAGQHVEEHAGVLIFLKSDLKSFKGWSPQPLTTVARGRYVYVRLNGERITFKAASAKTAQPNSARNTTPAATASQGLGLPHLAQCCGAQAAMKSEFRHPNYQGAIAVFDLPTGRVSTCGAYAPGVSQTRIDTRLEIDNDGVLIIATTDPRREIRLKGKATVLVANIPLQDITGVRGAGGSQHHYTAYYDMIDKTMACAQDFACAVEPAKEIRRCFDPSIIRESAPTTTAPDWGPLLRVDFQCSNTQYP